MVTTAGGWETVGLSQGQPAQVRGKEGSMGKYQIPIRGDITIYQTPKIYKKYQKIIKNYQTFTKYQLERVILFIKLGPGQYRLYRL